MGGKDYSLKPCPFCGGTPQMFMFNRGSEVHCPDCGSVTTFSKEMIDYGCGLWESVEEHARKTALAWNRRA